MRVQAKQKKTPSPVREGQQLSLVFLIYFKIVKNLESSCLHLADDGLCQAMLTPIGQEWNQHFSTAKTAMNSSDNRVVFFVEASPVMTRH